MTFGYQGTICILYFALAISNGLGSQTVTLEEPFDYASPNEMLNTSNWKPLLGSAARPALLPLDGGASPCLALNNRGVQLDFSPAITEGFTLKILMCQSQDKKRQYVALTGSAESDGTVSGYGFAWDSGVGGKGIWSITKFNMPEDKVGTQTAGEPLLVPAHSPINIPPAEPTSLRDFTVVTFTWDKSGDLNLTVDGETIATVKDTAYHTFSRLYLDGNDTGYFAGLKLTGTSNRNP